MSSLDLRTVFVTYAVTGFACLAAVLSVWWRNRHTYPALGLLVGQLAMQAVGTAFIAARGSVPDWLSIIVANLLLGGALVVGYYGLQRLSSTRAWMWPNYVLLAAFLAVHVYFTYIEPRLDVRIINTSAIQLILSTQCTYLLLSRSEPRHRRSVRFLAVVFGGYCLVNIARVGVVGSGAYAASDYMDSSTPEAVFVLVWLVLLVLFAYGIALMVNELLAGELRAQEQKFSTAFQSVPVGVLMARMSTGEVVEVNDAFATITGHSKEEAVGKTTEELGLWAEEADRQRIRATLLEEGGRQNLECRFRRKSGESYTGLASGEIISVDGEQFLVASIADIEERKRAEKGLRESQEQLLQAQKMEAVGQLAGGVAHDFNNLLGVILGYTDLALDQIGSKDGDSTECLNQVKSAAERATTLTRQILAYSRRQTLRPAVLSLNEVMWAMEALLKRTLGEDIELRIDAHDRPATVEADRHQLEQVLLNLALNARDAMTSGGMLTVRTEILGTQARSPADMRVVAELGTEELAILTVADTGVGMDSDTKERVFEPFFTTKAPGIGSGLGMSVVYGVVKQSKGHVEVESQLGKGTVVRIYLPLVQAGVLEESPPSPDAAGPKGTETILVVEDEAALRDLVARVLQHLGYQVVAASTAFQALVAFEVSQVDFDLLLTDVVLPGSVQGSDLAKMLCSRRPGLPVLYMSGYPRDSIVHAGRLAEGISLLEKPFTPHALAVAIREVLDKVCA